MSQPTGTIRHPNKPNVVVTVTKPLRSQLADLQQKRALLTKPMAVERADGGIVYKGDGTPEIYLQPQPEPMALRIESLLVYKVAWSGVTDGDGRPIEPKPENLHWLWDNEDLDVKLGSCLLCKKTEHSETEERDHFFTTEPSFGSLILYELRTNEKVFDPDPTASVSASPST